MSLKSGRAAPNKKDCTVFVVREDIEIKCMQGQQVGVVCDTSLLVQQYLLVIVYLVQSKSRTRRGGVGRGRCAGVGDGGAAGAWWRGFK